MHPIDNTLATLLPQQHGARKPARTQKKPANTQFRRCRHHVTAVVLLHTQLLLIIGYGCVHTKPTKYRWYVLYRSYRH